MTDEPDKAAKPKPGRRAESEERIGEMTSAEAKRKSVEEEKYMAVDPYEITSRMKEFESAIETMKSEWSDRRDRVQEALMRWAGDHGEGGNRLLYERLCGWADIVLLRQYLLSAGAGSHSHLSNRLVDDEDFWDTDVRGLFESKPATGREIAHRIVLDAIFKPIPSGKGD
jgi:hypothetical protein